MILMCNRKEIYHGFSISEFNRIKDILSRESINYDFRTVNRNTSAGFDTSRGRIGSMGENMKYSYEYYIYIHKKDYDEAVFLINNSDSHI